MVLIGATTQNPFFEVNAPLVSRSRVFELKPLRKEHILSLTRSALEDAERGLGNMQVRLDDDAADHLAEYANGDARSALNALEVATHRSRHFDGVVHKTWVWRRNPSSAARRADAAGDMHTTSSAFIKSMRGSDPDAALHYLARMIQFYPRFIARRLMIRQSEDGHGRPRRSWWRRPP